MPGDIKPKAKLYYNAEETITPEISRIQGIIPPYVRGDFIRVGPGLWDLPEASMNHMLDGYAMLLKFGINENEIKFEKKYLESEAYKRALAAKKPVVNEFGTRAFKDSTKSFFSRVVATLMPELSDNNYSTPVLFNSDLFLSAESGAIRSLNPHSLQSPDRHDAKKCFGCEALTAHPMLDDNGDLFVLGQVLSRATMKNAIIRIPGGGLIGQSSKDLINNAKVMCTLPNRRSGAVSSLHSFGMTRNYLILPEHSFSLIISKVLTSPVKGTTIKEWIEWHPEDRTMFYVIDKATGKILPTKYMSASPFFFMHVINCYEESNQLIVDINCYDSPAIMDTLTMSNLRSGNAELKDHPYPCRFVLPLIDDLEQVEEGVNLVNVKSSSVAKRQGGSIVITPEVINDIHGAELPTLNPNCKSRKYTYYYMAGTHNPSPLSHSITKVNVDKKEIKVWKENNFNYPSEPIFIPNPTGTSEDDGVLVSAVTDSRPEAKDFLLFLDGKTMEEIGRADFTNPIPTGLHGVFIPTTQ